MSGAFFGGLFVRQVACGGRVGLSGFSFWRPAGANLVSSGQAPYLAAFILTSGLREPCRAFGVFLLAACGGGSLFFRPGALFGGLFFTGGLREPCRAFGVQAFRGVAISLFLGSGAVVGQPLTSFSWPRRPTGAACIYLSPGLRGRPEGSFRFPRFRRRFQAP